MSYADGLLSTGERITFREKQHWFVFVWGARYPWLAIILGLVILVLSQGLSAEQRSGPLGTFMNVAVVALVLGGLAFLVWHALRYWSHEYVLTNRRVIQVEGVLNKTSMDSSLEKINDARLSQSVFGRMFGFGDLDILTASDTGIDRFRMIRGPVAFKKAMLDAKHEYELEMSGGDRAIPSPPLRAPAEPAPAPIAGTAAVGAPPLRPVQASDDTVSGRTPGSPEPARLSPDDLTRTLASLADLRDRGAITAEEYERKKADLLGRL